MLRRGRWGHRDGQNCKSHFSKILQGRGGPSTLLQMPLAGHRAWQGRREVLPHFAWLWGCFGSRGRLWFHSDAWGTQRYQQKCVRQAVAKSRGINPQLLYSN